MQDGTTFTTDSCYGVSKKADLAILKIKGNDLPRLPLAKDPVRQGQTVFIMGNPDAKGWTLSPGLVIRVARVQGVPIVTLRTETGQGGSGSPVLNNKGEVVGVIWGGIEGERQANATSATQLQGLLADGSTMKLSTALARVAGEVYPLDAMNEEASGIPQDPDLKAALREFDAERYSQAIPFFRKYLARNEHDEQYAFVLAVCDVANAEWTAAEKLRTPLSITYQDGPDFWFCLGLSLAGQAENKDAVRAYQKAAILKPDRADVQLALGKTHIQLENYNEALKAYSRAITLGCDKAEGQCGVGIAYLGLERFDEAVTALRKAVVADPFSAAAYTCLGLAYGGSGRYQASRTVLEKAVRLDSDGAWGKTARELLTQIP